MTDPITRGQEQAAIAFRDRVMPLSFTPDELQADVRAARTITNRLLGRATLPANAKPGDLYVALDPIDEDTLHVYRGELVGKVVYVRWFCSHHKDRLVELVCRTKQDRAAFWGLLKADRILLLDENFGLDPEQVDEWINGSDLQRP